MELTQAVQHVKSSTETVRKTLPAWSKLEGILAGNSAIRLPAAACIDTVLNVSSAEHSFSRICTSFAVSFDRHMVHQ